VAFIAGAGIWTYKVSDKVSVWVHIHVWNFKEKCFHEFLLTRNESISWGYMSFAYSQCRKLYFLPLYMPNTMACLSHQHQGWECMEVYFHSCAHLDVAYKWWWTSPYPPAYSILFCAYMYTFVFYVLPLLSQYCRTSWLSCTPILTSVLSNDHFL